MVARNESLAYVQSLLQVDMFNDYAPNGLQVEGKDNILKIVTGVTANKALIDAAVDFHADAIIVHHGYFWKNEDPRVIGIKKQRIQLLLQHDINLMGYHLPLDAHQTFGNNVQLAKRLGFNINGYAGQANLIAYGDLNVAMTPSELANSIGKKLNRMPLIVGPHQKPIKKIAWCTGAAQNYIQVAIDLGVDAYLSGEISEQTTHMANENEIVYFAAGHHATERYGVQALGVHLAEKFSLQHQFVEIENPV